MIMNYYYENIPWYLDNGLFQKVKISVSFLSFFFSFSLVLFLSLFSFSFSLSSLPPFLPPLFLFLFFLLPFYSLSFLIYYLFLSPSYSLYTWSWWKFHKQHQLLVLGWWLIEFTKQEVFLGCRDNRCLLVHH